MKKISYGHFYGLLHNKRINKPIGGQIELTYRCNLNCLHCYCKGLENKEKELNTLEWKKILDEIQREGCVYLTFTGGEPLIRKDFLELYSYAKKKGFIITIFTNGIAFNSKIIDYLAKFPPYGIEITLNGITKATYETITQVNGSFPIVMENIKKLKEKNFNLLLKSNCLKQNKDEISKIKVFADKFFGRKKSRYHFKYDTMIYPKLNGNKGPTNFRLSFKEILELKKQDKDIWKEYRKRLNSPFPRLKRDRDFLYHCNSWMMIFVIDPYGWLKFCNFSKKYSVNLKKNTLKEGFYKRFSKLLNEKFKSNSKCRNCHLRAICCFCPARSYLETGNEEGPVGHYCQLARGTLREKERFVR